MTGRQLTAVLLAIVAVALAFVGGLSRYLRDEIVAPRPFADRALAALDREPVRAAVVDAVATQVEQRVPSGLLSAQQARTLAERVVATRAFRRSFRRTALDANRVLFQDDAGAATLRLGALTGAFDTIDPRISPLLGDAASQQLLSLRGDDVGLGTKKLGDGADSLASWCLPLALFALLAALLLAPRRLAVIRVTAICALLAGALLLVSLALGRAAVVDAAKASTGVSVQAARDAAGAAWEEFTDGLRPWALGAVAAGLIVTALTLLPAALGSGGRRRPAA
ncbi:hypothetical protein Q5424_28855 [Conexibacter sp. JD483]|uniref:hypothetical protein n=1 Tax=unclassified Conexibacter TaxID=2627773 RepID=UPI002716AFE6|nr:MULTISPECIES: hypothetical protein [unclassified Conexibacter]MDO8189601.1 hypothetical protein [Conexibacter sp. CPCC 205706]MDO8202119.1 hypothetical protein [Conexibacter sp. CPCC 205762]MDR9373143.1 hypothetical protein [Conexibacter sp. JD483]